MGGGASCDCSVSTAGRLDFDSCIETNVVDMVCFCVASREPNGSSQPHEKGSGHGPNGGLELGGNGARRKGEL